MQPSISHSIAESADADRLIGQMLDSRLRVLRCIGRGGMGTVYVAEHIGLGKQVAVKVLNAPYAGQPEVIARLHGEARNAAAIASQHIVDIFDIGRTDSGQPYVVMELLLGESLAERLRRCTALSELDTLHIGRQLASALAAAHRSGIVHRDIKPENIFLCHRDGGDFVKLLDFGISKAIGPLADGESDGDPASLDEPSGSAASAAGPDAAPSRGTTDPSEPGRRDRGQVSDELLHRLTRTGAILGTPLYMSPEQARGERLDSRCDIYSLGVVLYECLTGSVPFLSTSYFGVIAKILTETPEPPSARIPDRALSAALEQIVLCAMASERNERYQTMDALLADLDRYQRGEPVQAWTAARAAGRAGGRGEVAGDAALAGAQRSGLAGLLAWRRDRGPLPLLLPLLAGTLVAVLLGGLLVFWRGPQTQANPATQATALSATASQVRMARHEVAPSPAPSVPAASAPAGSAPARDAPTPPASLPAGSAAAPPLAGVGSAGPDFAPAPAPAAAEQLPGRPASRKTERPSTPRSRPKRPPGAPPAAPPPPAMPPLGDEQAPNPFVSHAP